MIALLLAEGLFFTLRFDSAAIDHVDSAWAKVAGQAWVLGRFSIAVATALVIFAGARSARRLAQWAELEVSRNALLAALSVHGLAILAFYHLTARIFEDHAVDSAMNPAWLAGWAGAGVLALVAWASALVRPVHWARIIKRRRGLLILGTVVAMAAILAGRAAEYFWPLLCRPTLSGVEWVLRLFFDDVEVWLDDLTIRLQSFRVIIDAECSGFEGVGLIAVFVGGFLWSFRDRLRFPQSLLLLPLGMLAIWAANIVRIAMLVAIGAGYSESIALGGFHSQAGWLAFNAVALGLIYVAWRHPAFANDVPTSADDSMYHYAAGPELLPLLMLVAVMMITAAFSAEGFDWLYPFRVAATLAVLAYFWRAYRERRYLQWTWAWTPFVIGGVVFAVWIALEPFSGVGAEAHARQAEALAGLSPAAAFAWIAFRAIGSVIAVPAAEELAFRGYLTRQLIADPFDQVPVGRFTWFSFLVSSAAFGALHGRWIAGILAGMLFAMALYRRGRMLDAVLAHATANALLTIYVIATDRWATWS